MSETGKKWLRGCSLGCGGVLVLIVIGAGFSSLVLMSPFKKAIESREALEGELGERRVYQPASDGAIPTARMEAFLRVRRSVMEHCEKLTLQTKRLEQMDELGDAPKAGEAARRMFDALKAMTGVGTMTGEFFLGRNEALLREQMSLEEYTYIFVVAFGNRLHVRRETEEESSIRPLTTRRVRADLRRMLQAQLDAARSATASSTEGALRVHLENEIEALETDLDRIPWQDGLPGAIESSLAPYREELDQRFCPDILEFELARNRKFLIGIQSD